MTKRIWFNRTFATAAHYVDMIKNNPDGRPFEIYATHPKRHSLMLQVADYAELEPKLPISEYPAYCIDFCRRHEIDLFIPHFALTEISLHVQEFEQNGTKVMLGGDSQLLHLIEDKGEVFSKLAHVDGLAIPEYRIVTTAREFEEAYQQLRAKGLEVCCKPVKGEGGTGFWMIDDEPPVLESLFQSAKPILYIGEILRRMSAVESFEPLMVMELLEGPEYSVDCLGGTSELLAAVPRKKVEGRIRELEFNEDLIGLAQKIHAELPLQFNFNIQFIYQGDTPKLLEINPRMSGGLYTSCLSGINFPYLALKLLQGENVAVPQPKLDVLATHIEKEFVLRREF